MRLALFIFWLPFVCMAQQTKDIADTLVSGKDSIVLFEDKTWEYMHTLKFTGTMCSDLENRIAGSNLVTDWDNDITYNYSNDMQSLTDSIWLCTVDSIHQNFVMPTNAPLTSSFKMRGKRFHYGVDLDLETGDTVRCAFDGVVRYAKYNGAGFGYLTVVRHYNGLETYYAHLSKISTKPNQEIRAGDLIGLGGNTGKSTGSHLHFETRFYHNPINPEKIIDFEKGVLKDENMILYKDDFNYRKIDGSKRKFALAKNKTPAQIAREEKVASQKKWHVVKRGDSLYAMALKHNTSVKKICSLNGISAKKILNIGERLRVR
ncbi:M23 family metallopeptidase [Flavobacteriales bacterium]|nr:M23 family metallopeptidase [Flavobacteriales bacterium]